MTTGKVLEHIAPHLPGFPYSPSDARFVGNPVDYIVFDGLSEGTLRQVVLVEVKTGGSALNAAQKQIRDAALAHRVDWFEYRIGAPAPVLRSDPAAVINHARRASNGTKVVLPELMSGATEATIARWVATPGTWVAMGEPLVEVETQDVSYEIPANSSGRLHVIAERGDVVSTGAVIAKIDPSPTN